MNGYTFDILKARLTDRYDSDIAGKRKPFEGMSVPYWSVTSGHPEETILAVQEQIRRDRETRVEPVVDPDFVDCGK